MRVGENITHRADGRWEARYIKGRSENGSAIYGFCYGKTYDEAAKRRDDAQLLFKNSVVETPKTFGEIYSIMGGAAFSDATARAAERQILPILGTTPINAVSDSDLAEVLRDIKRKCSSEETKHCFDLIRIVFDYAVSEEYLPLLPIGELTMKYGNGRRAVMTKGFVPITEQEILTLEQAKELESCLITGAKSKNFGVYVGLYLCLELGLLRNEVGALQLKDIDFVKRTLSVNKILGKQLKTPMDNALYESVSVDERIIPLPKYIYDFLTDNREKYSDDESFLVCGKNGVQCAAKEYSKELRIISSDSSALPLLEMKFFRDTFVVRCIRSGFDIFTISALTGIQSIADIQSRYGAFFKSNPERLCSFESFMEDTRFENNEPEKLNLLILGAGGYGRTVKEIADKIGIFNRISFLDDNTAIDEAIDTCENFTYYKDYPCAFPAFGNCELRKSWIDRLSAEHFIVPRIIDPAATISPSAVIADAVVIEANVIVNAQAKINRGCIISSGALIDRGAVIEEAVHIECSSTIAKDSVVPRLTKIESGAVFDSSKF